MKPIVAIIGRPNVGKSTLFNRLIGERQAVISKKPGTTRDRLFGELSWQGFEFILIDTGGIETENEKLKKDVLNQAKIAIEDADLLLFLVDAKDGLKPSDKKTAQFIRKSKKKSLLVVNKADNLNLRNEIDNFRTLGFSDPIAISSIHGTGTGDLLDSVVSLLKNNYKKDKISRNIKDSIFVSILGRPNVGKSSLINQIFKKERAIVSEVPGTTRDVLDVKIKHKDQAITLLDTAGIRRRGKIEKGIEKYSVIRALGAIDRSDISLILIDASEGITSQDLHICSYILEKGNGIIIVINKWDLVEEKTEIVNYLDYLQKKVPFLSFAPVVFISAKTGKNVNKVLDLILDINKEMSKKIPIKKINEFISKLIILKKPPSKRTKETKIYYSTKTKSKNPTFVLFCNNPSAIHFSYKRYLENKLREQFGFVGLPLKLIIKSKKD